MEEITEDLFDAFKRGDERAFRYYYEMHYHSLSLFGLRLLKDEAAVTDMAQEVFVNLWKSRETIESIVHLRMFIYQSMRHRCINQIRVKKLEERYRNEYMMFESEADFEDRVIEEEVHRLVMAEINQLPREQRRVVLMHLGGKNNMEIAEVMQVSVNTVKTHKARARQQLKTKLNDLFLLSVVLGL